MTGMVDAVLGNRHILANWQAWQVAQAVAVEHGGGPWALADAATLQRNARYGLWQLTLRTPDGKRRAAILKILGSSRRMRIERNLYLRGYSTLAPLLPRVYACRRQGARTWIFQEHVRQLAGRHPWTPETFTRVIPTVARLHAATYRRGGSPAPRDFGGWVPSYAGGYYAGRDAYRQTRAYLRRALRRPRLAAQLRPYRRLLLYLLRRGPASFRELRRTGWAIIHGDLHAHNICCNDLDAENWDIRLIDWESMRYAPVWFDLIVLVEMLMDFRPDWRSRQGAIRRRAIADYLKAMESHGIRIGGDHMRLYRLAYLQRTLERGLRTQLRRALEGREAALLKPYLRKVRRWSRRLGLVPRRR
ncbi:MAG TPA: phosphotransferase [Bacillota bacterium]